MGDVVHAVPVVEDIKRFISDAEIDWLVEDSFADIPRHVAGVSEVIECSVRKWKKRIFEKSTRDQIKALREKLRGKHYDLVIDLQGLIKSAVLASWTNAPVAGYDRRSGKEPLATILYSVKSSVDRQKSAVDRCRELAAKSLGYDLGSTKPQFNFKFEGSSESAGSVFFFCNTSRETKLWPEEKWIELGGELIRRGKKIVLLWGSPEEKERVLRIQARLGAAAEVPERMPIGQLMEKISSADAVIIELDLHGKNAYQARVAIDAALRRCGGGVYRLRLIHGYHGGTALRDLCREYAGHPRVLRLVASPGSTDLVLREF